MRDRRMYLVWRLSAAVVPVALVAAAIAADRPIMRVAPEVGTEGITSAERDAQQARLHSRLITATSERAFDNPVRVPITAQDRADMAAPHVSGTPLKIGVVKKVTPAVEAAPGQPFSRGVVQETATGGFTWTMTISSPDAQAIRVHFRAFSLPAGAEMYIFNELGEAHGPYVAQGRNNDGDFWTHSVSSDTAVLMLASPGPGHGKFVIDRIGHIGGRRPVAVPQAWPDNYCDNPSCVLDANCGSVAPASQEAIAKMEWISGVFIYTCTGGLIADTDNSSQRNLFLTANHCLSKSRDAANMETYFEYTTSSCNGECPPWPSTPDTVGATILASSRDGDFTLMELNENPPSGRTFLGWNNAPIAYTNEADLHRVSNPNYGPQVYSHHEVDPNTGTCSGLPRGEFIYSTDVEGATDGGSSGAPVVNSAGEIVGQLFGCCGYNCGDPCDSGSNWTVDGALAFYYSSVEEFLDPEGCTPVPEVCDNGVDDDCDTAVDCDDPDCEGDPACDCVPVPEVCDNGVDDDCDTAVDCDDTDCASFPACACGQTGDPCTTNADCCTSCDKKAGTCR